MRLSHADYRRVNEAIAAMYRVAFTSDPCPAAAAVLAKVLGGISNAAILRGSEVLGGAVSEPELLGHLENIYTKLGVENRHGAARHVLERLPGALG